MAARLYERYRSELIPALQQDFEIKNVMAVPRLEKISINMGVGRAVSENNPKLLESAQKELTTIAGQRAVLTQARKAISNFKLREGYQIGVRVTLRGARMYEFFDRLVNVAMPRIRDFRGYSVKSFDGRGNYSLGLREQTIFPEIDPDAIGSTQGMDITIVTSAKSNEQGQALLAGLGFPFRDGKYAVSKQQA
jgi:large subunit ribosomal protein L5